MASHSNALLIERLFVAIDRHDGAAVAACYRDDSVVFHDIAFHIESKPRLADMWRMVCEGESGLKVSIKSIVADDHSGEARIVDTYCFGKDTAKGRKGRPVVNEIRSLFQFRDGLIQEHIDECDQRAWGEQAIGGTFGWLAGRVRFLRSFAANRKLDRFLRKHPLPPAPAS